MDTHFTSETRKNGFTKQRLLLLLFFSFVAEGTVLAQQKPNFTIKDVTAGSDWNVRLQVSGASSDMDCWGTDTYSYEINRNGTKVATHNGSLADGAVVSFGAGVNSGGSWSMVYKTVGSRFNCHYWKNTNVLNAQTGPLKPPKDVVASDSTSEDALLNQVRLTWTKGTNE